MKLALYFVIPALSAVSPLLVIPAIASRFGAAGWTTVAIALSVGSTCGVIAELGWGVVGPQFVARRPAEARQIYESSLASKIIAVAALSPLAAVISVAIARGNAGAASLVAVSGVIAVVSPSWYFIGLGKPLLVLMTDSVPRLVVSLCSAALIHLGAPLFTYGIAQILASVVSYALAVRFGRLPAWPSRSSFLAAPRAIGGQSVVILGRAISTVYTSLPTAVIGLVSPAQSGMFSSADRPMRMGIAVLGGVPSRLQSWVGTPDVALARERIRKSILINVTLGMCAGVAYVVFAPLAIRILFAGAFPVDGILIVLEGLLAATICASRGLGLALVAVGRPNSITYSIIAGAVLGGLGLLVLAHLFGADGAVAALVVAEMVGIAMQSVQLRAHLRSDRSDRANWGDRGRRR